MKKRQITVMVILLLIVAGCSVQLPLDEEEKYIYQVPEKVEGDLPIGHIEENGINLEKISSFFDKHLNGKIKYLHSLLILKNGKLVVEEYFRGDKYYETNPITWQSKTVTFDRNTRHYMASVTKSFISALIGVCLDKSLIKSLDQPIIQFFPEYSHLFDEQKSKITIKHVLGMKSGFTWRKDDPHDSTLMINSGGSWVEYVLSRSLDSDPGSKWLYNDGLSVILADIVSRASGHRADLFAKKNLLDPLGISSDTFWVINQFDEIGGGWGLFMLPRDMVKFGKLFLQKGNWDGTQLISKSWVEKSWEIQEPNATPGYPLSYGLHWWTFNYGVRGEIYKSLEASGAGGQHIIIIPALDLVVVFTMGDYDRESVNARIQMEQYILPACL